MIFGVNMMKRRKTICLITGMPEMIHGKRISKGVFAQCEKYGYNVAVFASMSHLLFFVQDHTYGEKNIYTLPNYALFDGIILDTVTLTEDTTGKVLDNIYQNIKEHTDAPTVCIGMPFKEFKTITGSNEKILREMCRHVVLHHGKKDILILTGTKGNSEAEERLEIFTDELTRLGISVDEDHKVYGDFWYTSGIALAKEILAGDRPMPEAVIAAGDHMALGMIEVFSDHGIRVPEDVVVIGFEATDEAMLAETTLSSYESNFTKTAADAVDYLRSVLEPDAEILPYQEDLSKMFHPGMSCGCEPDIMRSAKAFRESLYCNVRNYTSEKLMQNIDIGLLMESYASEELTASATPAECINNIFNKTYLLSPFVSFSICLREDWLNYDTMQKDGYPDTMKIVVANSILEDANTIESIEDAVSFDTALMLPEMQEYTNTPCVFYFAPVHFGVNTLGYAVLQRELSDPHLISLVFRNWLRLVNNSLEMMRAKNRYIDLSVRDNMTGLYNRRGMYERFDEMRINASEADRLFVCVIDMDGLKYINDTFGHSEGDFGIMALSYTVINLTKENEICVRAGGDEFFILGIGAYSDQECSERCNRLESLITEHAKKNTKPYALSASIGCFLGEAGQFDLNDALSKADAEMYRCKTARKKQRKE